jgi:hypothetical protein
MLSRHQSDPGREIAPRSQFQYENEKLRNIHIPRLVPDSVKPSIVLGNDRTVAEGAPILASHDELEGQ